MGPNFSLWALFPFILYRPFMFLVMSQHTALRWTSFAVFHLFYLLHPFPEFNTPFTTIWGLWLTNRQIKPQLWKHWSILVWLSVTVFKMLWLDCHLEKTRDTEMNQANLVFWWVYFSLTLWRKTIRKSSLNKKCREYLNIVLWLGMVSLSCFCFSFLQNNMQQLYCI